MIKNKTLIIGFGRMGISHASQLGLILRNSDIYVYDPSFKVKVLIIVLSLFTRIRYTNIGTKSDMSGFDHIFITSPPKYQENYFNRIKDKNTKIFVEKPINIQNILNLNELPKNIYVGYVMQHVEAFMLLKKVLNGRNCSSAYILMETNSDLTNAHGWRANSFDGSIVSEYGSHMLNLFSFITEQECLIKSSRIDKKNQIDLDLELKSQLTTGLLVLKYNSKNVRKTNYSVKIRCDDDIFEADLYSFKINGVTKFELSQEKSKTNTYLRGAEFSRQMENFLDNNNFSESLRLALSTKEALYDYKKKFDNTWR